MSADSDRPGSADPAPGAGRVRPCRRSSPNCVSTRSTGRRHGADPIPFTGPIPAAQERLRRALATLPRITVVAEDPGWLEAEARTRSGFVDDLELELVQQVDPATGEPAGRIHFHSASRTGWWDLGVNRRRTEAIRRAFLAAG